MAFSGKHIVEEMNGTRCSLVENGASAERRDFLSNLLSLNGFQVISIEVPPKEEGGQSSFKVGVTDLLFNPTIAVYEKSLKNKDGIKITADYWNQLTDGIDPYYWNK